MSISHSPVIALALSNDETPHPD